MFVDGVVQLVEDGLFVGLHVQAAGVYFGLVCLVAGGYFAEHGVAVGVGEFPAFHGGFPGSRQ